MSMSPAADPVTPATPVAPAGPRTTRTRGQRVWLVLYWLAAVPPFGLLLASFGSPFAWSQRAIVLLALSSVVIGCVLATISYRWSITFTAFIKATTTVRAIAVTWMLLGAIIVLVPVLSVLFVVELGTEEWVVNLLGTVGSVSFIAMLGPGYAEYRSARTTAGHAP